MVDGWGSHNTEPITGFDAADLLDALASTLSAF